MTAKTLSDYPVLGFVPARGDTHEADTLVTTLSGVRTALQEIKSVLHGADAGEWRGEAAYRFRDLLDDDLRPKIDQATEAFDGAWRHLSTWSRELEGYQSSADRLEDLAAAAQRRADAAQDRLDRLPAPASLLDRAGMDDEQREAEERNDDARRGASGDVTAATGEVAELRRQAEELRREWEQRGLEIGRLLQDGIDIAPAEPGWLDQALDSLGDFFDAIEDALDDLGDWIMDVLKTLAPLLDIIGDIASLLSAVLGLLAFIPGLQFLALPALVLAGVALAAHYLAAVGETGSFLEALKDPTVIMDAVGLVLGLGAFKIAKGLTQVAEAAGQTKAVVQLNPIRALRGLPLVTEQVPLNMFQMCGLSMSNTQMYWRLANVKGIQAGLVLNAVQLGDFTKTLSQIGSWDFGPLLNRKPVVV